MTGSTLDQTTSIGPPAETLVDERLYVVGGLIPLDGRVSWVPADATGFQPSNAFALVEGEHGLLIETGLAYHEALLLNQLAGPLSRVRDLKVLLTRAEMDVISNLGAIHQRFGVDELVTGGLSNPFDAFDDANSEVKPGRRQIDERSKTGDSIIRSPEIELGLDRKVEVFSPVLRFLPTYWGWDGATRTLFTSDSFSHTAIADETSPRVIDENTPDSTTVEAVEAFMFAKFEWLARARTESFRQFLIETFDKRQPEILAPTRGCVLKGRKVVERHLALVLDALSDERRQEGWA